MRARLFASLCPFSGAPWTRAVPARCNGTPLESIAGCSRGNHPARRARLPKFRRARVLLSAQPPGCAERRTRAPLPLGSLDDDEVALLQRLVFDIGALCKPLDACSTDLGET